jgi:uncharacterized lipoprotein YajG
MKRLTIVLMAGLMLAACSEKPQTATSRKADDKPWAAADPQYMANGFAGGDQAAWEKQIKNRTQGQNEYNRTNAR